MKKFNLHLVSDSTGETVSSVARACIAHGIHYIDLADGRDFVIGMSDGLTVPFALAAGPAGDFTGDQLRALGKSRAGAVAQLEQSLDVGADAWDFRPVTLAEILARMATLPPYQADDHHVAAAA